MVTFLPVVRRELRVAARRRSTFLVRFLGAVAAVMLGGVFLLPAAFPGVAGASGRLLLQILGTLALILVLIAGPLLTADCISRERREGTLGFLFLTDLNGFDVVAGKFTALALMPLHALLAALPVAALTVCLGGVTGREFWAVQAVLLNSLFLSLALGLWVSTLATDDRQAAGTAFALVAGLTILPSLGAAGINALVPHSPWTLIQLASPSGLLTAAFENDGTALRRGFLSGFLFQHALAWCFVALAALIVRHGWREQGAIPHASDASRANAPARARAWMAARDENRWPDGPLAWYAWHHSPARRSAGWIAWGAAIIAVLVFATMSSGTRTPLALSLASGVLTTAFYLLKLLLAVHAIYFLHDACRSGAMELLLATPVQSRALCEGHLAAIRRLFLAPYLILALTSIALHTAGRLMDGGDWPSLAARVTFGMIPAVFAAALHGLDFIAVAFHASRWALHYDRPSKTLMRTSVLVLLLPALFCSVGRLFVDLFVILQNRPLLSGFRDLVRGWYFPGALGTSYGAPRAG